MMPPPAIARFTILWWGSLLAWLVATAIAWPRTQHVLEASAATRPAAGFVQPATVVLVVLITVIPWFFARQGSRAARWTAALIAVLAVLRVAALLVGSIGVGLPAPVTVALFVLAAVLDAAAVLQLFRLEAEAWFDPFDDDDAEMVE